MHAGAKQCFINRMLSFYYFLERKPKEESNAANLLDKLFRKTTAQPCIYWLPLTKEQVRQVFSVLWAMPSELYIYMER